MDVGDELTELIGEDTLHVLLEEVDFEFGEEVDLALEAARGGHVEEAGFLHVGLIFITIVGAFE